MICVFTAGVYKQCSILDLYVIVFIAALFSSGRVPWVLVISGSALVFTTIVAGVVLLVGLVVVRRCRRARIKGSADIPMVENVVHCNHGPVLTSPDNGQCQAR